MLTRTFSLGVTAAVLLGLGACTQTRDQFVDSHSLTELSASLWVDPDGCKHWFIDDGVEGYLSPVLNPDGTPECI